MHNKNLNKVGVNDSCDDIYFIVLIIYILMNEKVNSMSYFDSNKKYRFIHLIAIPIQMNPFRQIVKLADVIIYALLPTVQAILTANVVDYSIAFLNGEDIFRKLLINFVALVLCIAGEYLNDLAMTYIDKKNEINLLTKYQEATIQKRSRLKYKFIENEDSRNLIDRVCTTIDTNKFLRAYNNIIRIISLSVTSFSLLIVVAQKTWWLSILIVLISIPLFLLSMKVGKGTYEENKEVNMYEREAEYLQSVLRNRDSVDERSLFLYTDYVNDLWYKKYELVRKIKLRIEIKYLVKLKGAGVITAALSFSILSILLYPLYRGEISIGLFMALAVAFVELVNAISWSLVDITKELASSNAYIKDLNEFFHLEEVEEQVASVEENDKKVVQRLDIQKIRFEDVSFKYPFSEKYILNHFSVEMAFGKHYAIVGKNGAGKTTITKLLLGLYDNYEGKIFIDDVELRELSATKLREIFAVVFQDFARYEVSLKDNIIIGDNLEYEKERFLHTIESLNIEDIVNDLQCKEESLLGRLYDTGVDLSGGQWQKLGIARAMYSKAPIQILDEPTASLDPIAESKMYKMFKEASAGKMMIMITHRMGAARIADYIIVVDEGCVKEFGTHQDLIKQKGIYADMYMTQKGWYEDEKKI